MEISKECPICSKSGMSKGRPEKRRGALKQDMTVPNG